jgi:hypothetical protein
LLVLDVSNPTAPVQIGSFQRSGGAAARDVLVSGGIAYVADRGLDVLDVSDPANPTLIGSYEMFPHTNAVSISGNLAYLTDGATFGELYIFDISNLATPTLVGHYVPLGHAGDIAISDNFAYLATGIGGLQVLDLSNPTVPSQVAIYARIQNASDGVLAGKTFYVIDNDFDTSSLRILDVSNLLTPIEIAYLPQSFPLAVFVSDNIAYLVTKYDGVRILDVSNPANPVRIGSYDSANCWKHYDVFVAENLAYVTCERLLGDRRLEIVDVSDPANSTMIGGYDIQGPSSFEGQVFVSNNLAYVSDVGALWILDVSDPTTPIQIGRVDNVHGKPFVTDKTAYIAGGASGLFILQLGDIPPFDLKKQAAPQDKLRNDNALTYTLTLTGPGLDVCLWDPLPTALRYVSGSITGTVMPAAVYSPTVHAVVWQGTLPTDTVQTIRFQVTPQLTDTGALSMPLSVANTAWLTNTENDTAVSAMASITVIPAPLFLGKYATPRDGLRNNDTLTYTLTISGAGQTIRLWDPLPAGIHYITGSITSTLTPPAVYSPTAKAVVWEGTLSTNTVQVVRFQVTPGITGTEALSLSLPIINTAWLTVTAGAESDRSISATVIVNGWRVYLPLALRDD